ncbi:unnamed protein product, partial [marine sediment metagenome]
NNDVHQAVQFMKLGAMDYIYKDNNYLSAFQEALEKDCTLLQKEKIQKKFERQLRGEEEKFKKLVENTKEGILVLQDHQIKYTNPVIIKNSGYKKEELFDKNFLHFVFHEDRRFVEEIYQYYLENENPEKTNWSKEFRLVFKDNKIHWVDFNAFSDLSFDIMTDNTLINSRPI